VSLEAPPRSECFAVFSQKAARIEQGEWARYAAQYFETRLTLESEARTLGDASLVRARVAVARSPGLDAPRARTCWGRAAERGDYDAARFARGGPGLAELAARCAGIWLVQAETPAPDDATALLVAAILAGVHLGPILSPEGELLGPKTARERLGV
jgi:hypothetical protein